MARNHKKNSRRHDREQRHTLTALARAVKTFSRGKPDNPARQIKFEALEPRVLLSADPFTLGLGGGLDGELFFTEEGHFTDAVVGLTREGHGEDR